VERSRSFAGFTLLFSFTFAAIASATPLHAPGIAVGGSGSHFFKVCSTCPNDGSFDSDDQGGDGVGAALSTGFADTFYSWLAEGVQVGPNALPVLKARAEAMNPSLTNPHIGIGTTSATAEAQGLTEYIYSGTTDGTYTISFHVDGTILGDDESTDAGVSIFNEHYVPELEGEFQHTFIAGARVSDRADLSLGQFADGKDVTFTVTPGQTFFVASFLTANALFTDCCSEAGVADVSHTFTADFTAGDTSLLSLVAAAPEPEQVLLVLLALLGVTLRLRSRARPRPARAR
jgi:hypothetical protein